MSETHIAQRKVCIESGDVTRPPLFEVPARASPVCTGSDVRTEILHVHEGCESEPGAPSSIPIAARVAIPAFLALHRGKEQ
eukprot:2905611-Rhodomonas_salina.1